MAASQWGALLWLDWRLLVNRVRTIARNPRRFLPWLIFLVWLLPSFFTRLTLRNRIASEDVMPSLSTQLAPLGALVPGLALAIVGLAVWRASMTAPAAFQSPADARFVIGAGLDSRAVFTWLSLRTARRLIVSFAVMLILVQVLYLPWLGFSFASALAFTVAVATYAGIVFGARMLAFTLQRAVPALPIGAIGLVLAIAGAAAFLASLVQLTGSAQVPAELLDAGAAVPPGSWLAAAIGGDFVGELALLAAAIGLTAVGVALAGDCYPELWATSSRAMALRRAMRSRRGFLGYSAARAQARAESRPSERRVRSASGARVPGGALVVFWKEWLVVRRGRGGLELQIGLLAAAVVLGVLVGHAVALGSRVAGIVAGVLVVLAIFWTWSAGVQLGRDIGNPLWWISSSALWRRLVVWTLARGLRYGLPLIVFAEAAAAGFGSNQWLLAVAPIPPLLLCWMSQTVGLAVYALLPAKTDYRLQTTLRMLSIYVIMFGIALAVAPGIALHNVPLLIAMPVLGIAIVIVGTVAFASWRIEGNGIVFAQEERQ